MSADRRTTVMATRGNFADGQAVGPVEVSGGRGGLDSDCCRRERSSCTARGARGAGGAVWFGGGVRVRRGVGDDRHRRVGERQQRHDHERDWSTSGKYGDALQFNGTNALVTIPDSASLHLSTGMTLEAWVDPSTVNANWRDVIYKGNDNFYLEATSTNGSLPGRRADRRRQLRRRVRYGQADG